MKTISEVGRKTRYAAPSRILRLCDVEKPRRAQEPRAGLGLGECADEGGFNSG